MRLISKRTFSLGWDPATATRPSHCHSLAHHKKTNQRGLPHFTAWQVEMLGNCLGAFAHFYDKHFWLALFTQKMAQEFLPYVVWMHVLLTHAMCPMMCDNSEIATLSAFGLHQITENFVAMHLCKQSFLRMVDIKKKRNEQMKIYVDLSIHAHFNLWQHHKD